MKKISIILIAMQSIVGSLMAQSESSDTINVYEINEVTVTGEKPLVKGCDGVMVVDLPAIVKDKPVTNILEALGYLPGVVNRDGLIGLAGTSDVTIILNGELTDMPLQNLYQLLYSTPADRMKNVEIMYTAPARYHVNGAVINIVMKTPSPLDGLQGQLRAGYNQAYYPSYGGGLSASYAVKEWTFDLNYGLSRSKTRNHEETLSDHLYEGNRNIIEDHMRRTSENLSNTIYAAVSNKRLRLTYNAQITSDMKGLSTSDGTLGNFTNHYSYDGPINFQNISLKYTAPFGLSAGGDYTSYKEKGIQSLYEGDDFLLGEFDSQSISRWHFYLDQEHKLGKWQFNYGVEYQHADDSSTQRQDPADETGGFSGKSIENVADAYIGLQRSFDWGLSFNVSAKGEYYHNDYRHNWNFIPQLGATFYHTPKSIFQLNISAVRIYPAYWALRNGTSHINPYSEVLGNPALQPYLNYSGLLSYIFRQKYVATLYIQYSDKATVQLPYQAPDKLRLIYQTINMNYKRTAGINLNVPINAGYIWNASATANIFHQREKADHFHDISFDHKKWIFYGELSNSFKCSHNSPVSFSIDFSYISPSLQGIADLSDIWRIDAGLKWQFGKSRSFELDIKADDIFNKWSPTMTIRDSGQNYCMRVHDMTRNLKLTIIWRFNGFQPKNDSGIDTSRYGTGK